MDDELRDQYNEIKRFLEKEGFNIFYVKEFVESDYDHVWDTEYDWKKFFEIAKKEGVKTILTESEVFSLPDNFDEISKNLEKDEIDLIKKNELKMGKFIFAWYVDNMSFSFTKSSDWYSKASSITSSDTNEPASIRSIGRLEQGKEFQEKIDELNKLSSEELEKEVREYVKAEKLLSEPSNEIPKRFRESKGIFVDRFDDPIPKLMPIILELKKEELARQKQALPELGKKFTKFLIESNASQARVQYMVYQFLNREDIKLDYALRPKLVAMGEANLREIVKKQKEEIPKLFDKAIEWARENKKSRFTKPDLAAFLSETETKLSKENADILYSKVNTELKK